MERLNAWLGVIANFGVIVGIAFLALEIEQNTTAMKAQTRNALSEQQTEWLLEVGLSEEARNLIFRGNQFQDAADLQGPDGLGYSFLMQSNLRMWENEYYQYKLGLFDDEEFKPRVDRWRFIASNPGRKVVWAAARAGYSPGFRELMDKIHGFSEETE